MPSQGQDPMDQNSEQISTDAQVLNNTVTPTNTCSGRRSIRSTQRDEQFIYYDSKSKCSIKWSPNRNIIETNYKLNDTKSLNKKIAACDRAPISLILKGGNVVIKHSTLGFELVRSLVQRFYVESEYLTELSQKVDDLL